jgi:hypothetical protein
MVSAKMPIKVEKELERVRSAERVWEAATAWRSSIYKELGIGHPLDTLAEQAITQSAALLSKREDEFLKLLEHTDISYDEGMTLLYGEEYYLELRMAQAEADVEMDY